MPEPIIADSARKHGVTDDDTLHAFRQWLRSFDLEDGVTMLVGPDRDGRLIEVGFVVSARADIVIIHALPARPNFLR